jgi:glycosyltransferase involved in cell wall biosynthesis
MKIGLIVPGFSADAEDWCIPALRHLARTLATQGDVRVIALRYPYRRSRYVVDGAETIALGGALSHRARTLALWRDTIGLLRAEHCRRPFDVLHAFWATESGLLASLAGRLLGVPTLVSLAGGELVALPDIGYGDQRLAWERLKVSMSLRLASAVSAGSRQLVVMAEQHLHGRRVHLAPLGVDLSMFSPGPRSCPATRVLHVATLSPVKDQVTLLRAFAVVRREHPDTVLELVGDGPLLAPLRQLAAELHLGSSVQFRGAVDHAQLPGVYAGAAAFVVSSRHEAQSMVALEAAACGVPLVGTRVGVLPEVTDALAAVGDHVGLAQALSATLAAGVRRTEQIQADYGLEVCTDRFRALYASLAAARA